MMAAMATASAVNTTDGPLITDDEGHVLAGGERGDVDTSVPAVRAAVLRGALLVDDRVAERIRKAEAGEAEDAVAASDASPETVEPAPAPSKRTRAAGTTTTSTGESA